MHDVFISYSSREMGTAETVRNILEKNGIPCWMAPRDIPGGSNYTKEIPVAIRNCQVFVLILSENAQSSQWVLKELDTAVNCGKVILPFMLEDCQLNDEFNFLLTGAQRYAAYQKKAEAMENLIKRIQAVTSTERIIAAEAATPHGEESPPQQAKPERDTVEVFLGLGKCPACGSEQIQQLDKVGKYVGKEERSYSLWTLPVWIGAILLGLLVLGLTTSFLLTFLVMGLTIKLGINLVRRSTDKKVHQLRVRKHIQPHPYRCEKCDWVFLLTEDGSPIEKK